MSETDSNGRRGFLVGAIYGLMGLISMALAIPGGLYLFFPPRTRRGDDWVEAADVEKLAANTPVEVVFRRIRQDGWKMTSEKRSAWVLKSSANQVTAFAPQCTHLGCAYHWDERKNNFLCPCHTSTFGVDGKVLEGPAPRPLDRYETKIEGGKLLLGAVKRSAEQAG